MGVICNSVISKKEIIKTLNGGMHFLQYKTKKWQLTLSSASTEHMPSRRPKQA